MVFASDDLVYALIGNAENAGEFGLGFAPFKTGGYNAIMFLGGKCWGQAAEELHGYAEGYGQQPLIIGGLCFCKRILSIIFLLVIRCLITK
jgi:hypothetical protein